MRENYNSPSLTLWKPHSGDSTIPEETIVRLKSILNLSKIDIRLLTKKCLCSGYLRKEIVVVSIAQPFICIEKKEEILKWTVST